jgi:23S rRNA pseudouridine1911/1915/1917 synthase
LNEFTIRPAKHLLYEDNHLLVIDKPAGVATMGASRNEPSVARAAAAFIKQKYAKPGNVYIGVVSRLDRLVSGVLILARTSKAASRLSAQLRARSPSKRYVALVEFSAQQSGLDEDQAWIRLEDYVRKNDTRRRMEVAAEGATGAQWACLSYRRLSRNRRMMAVEVDLHSGRKHQIRLQLATAGLPIIGDRKYGSQRAFSHGIALHCFRTTIEHPTLKTPMTFSSPPPAEWNRLSRPLTQEVSKRIQAVRSLGEPSD